MARTVPATRTITWAFIGRAALLVTALTSGLARRSSHTQPGRIIADVVHDGSCGK